MKKGIALTVIVVGIVLFGWIYGFRLTESGAIPGNVQILNSSKTVYGKAVLFEDSVNDSFGVARLKQYLGFLYQYDGGSNGYSVAKDKPFQVTGYGSSETKQAFVVGVKTAVDSNIKYIAVGNHLEDLSRVEKYELTLDDVYKHKEKYQVAEVVNHYTLFVLDQYSEDNWTFRAFDANGKLIADQLFAAEARYIDW
ncbi:hypothetical protein FHS15_004062 [Paenibacillus castaneae]|uniref:hypothetical protein n=1 Tax=Paenibacillus castaneae TaxID=474957 RepID=UPI000C9CCDF6|nr:hypothetical protein [Paenibacillus castaneae]NIK78916.1 hypothetical protein [Paenibacillus castaneae]